MKFQRDNTEVALTQEMKDAAAKKEADEKKELALAEKRKRKRIEEIQKRELVVAEKLNNLRRREVSYGPIVYQLDLLWHDMNNGVIPIDKAKANTWYQHIKEVKDQAPLIENWREELNIAQRELREYVANNEVEIV